jgi:hypothetical protein
MAMKQQNAHPREHVVERWAHALGVSGERLLTLVREVVEERQRDLLGAASLVSGNTLKPCLVNEDSSNETNPSSRRE